MNWKDKTCEKCVFKGLEYCLNEKIESRRKVYDVDIIGLGIIAKGYYFPACAEYKENL